MGNPHPHNAFQPGNDVGVQFQPGNDVGVQFDAGNQAAVKHGARGAELALRDGQPFTDLALAALQDVIADLGIDLDALPAGITRVILWRAARTEATARLCDNAALYHAAAGNLEGWNRYATRATHHGRTAAGLLRELAATLEGGPADYGDVIDALRDQEAE